MTGRTVRISVFTVLWLIAGRASSAGELWLGFEPTSPGPGDTVVVHLYDGSAERPYLADRVGRFQRLWRRGRADLRGIDGALPAARFVGERAGVVLVVYDSADGLGFCKSLVVVGSPAPGDPIRWSEIGQRLEIVPQTDPVELRAAPGTLELQVLYEREPLAGATVAAVRIAAPDDGLRATTDEIGVARLHLASGDWRITTTHRDPREPAPVSATLHLVVGEAAGD
ncbi:MAG TPA: DUF4198 domain-containing protein [Candidatus Polarisedimenticolaceae bacterium]|nr:DUF4198 domain-containing protein [Candidatus Polarisedimenticolaceae bacterium]